MVGISPLYLGWNQHLFGTYMEIRMAIKLNKLESWKTGNVNYYNNFIFFHSPPNRAKINIIKKYFHEENKWEMTREEGKNEWWIYLHMHVQCTFIFPYCSWWKWWIWKITILPWVSLYSWEKVVGGWWRWPIVPLFYFHPAIHPL